MKKTFKEKINLLFKKENIYCLFLILLIFGLDRYTKIIIINDFSENIYSFNNYVNFNLIWNTGVGFGLFSFKSILIYNSISLLMGLVIVFIIYTVIISEIIDKLIFSIIAGGAVGNFYDRLFYHAVPDFLDLHYNNFHWFTFNVADIFITLGILAFIMKGFFIKR